MFSKIAPHLVPLRSTPPRQGKKYAPSLLDHHQFHHSNEEYLTPALDPTQNQQGYFLKGHFVPVCRADQPMSLSPMRISEVAALLLEQTFGSADKEEEVFCGEWGMPENKSPGRVFWDTSADRIIVQTAEGITIGVKGTNVVEAAVLLPHLARSLQREPLRHVPEGFSTVVAGIEDGIIWSRAASPLNIETSLPNLDHVDHFALQTIIDAAIDRALANRL
ncbi:hypothetical protein COT42_05125 [Candidatus Saganbacteria bacterium CG08_land_8_20_14_0_20_45_16]|uniref:Uncharacterized protein n=1 Tax=Candidatus Saganbacteria bacterium CG08_land_8_20_14_0_20_45_16 TaxID=2014293 RepID=A0A2H0XXL3_UNCSA|nr:MAG: hypothetical protein COT42_05125 [Candidatus Saganbacteria bacterium CG08_land_8_20_14_0_20_45_16]